jgi:hypothetical protein
MPHAGAIDEVVRVPFHGREILAVEVDGKAHVFLRPVIESLGLDFATQLRKLHRRSWACVGQRPTQLPGDPQSRTHTTVDVRTLTMLLATIDEHRVAQELRQDLVAYQAEVAEVIEQYWTRGGAINPRATEEQLEGIIRRSEGQMRILRLADGLVDPHWLDAKVRHVAAKALGEEPEIDLTYRPLTVGEYLEGRGVVGSALRQISSAFGKKLAAAYRSARGEKPPKVERFVDGALRMVFGYTEADRPLFDQVWAGWAR